MDCDPVYRLKINNMVKFRKCMLSPTLKTTVVMLPNYRHRWHRTEVVDHVRCLQWRPSGSGKVSGVTKWSLSWWRHQMETFSAFLAICAGNSSVTGEFPAQRPVTRNFDVFFNLNKRLSKQWWGWWFETPLRPLWYHYNVISKYECCSSDVLPNKSLIIATSCDVL